MSNVSGACTSIVGCSAAASFHALKRTPATYSPDRPVEVSGNAAAVAGDDMAAGVETLDFHLQPLDRGIDEARGAAGGGVFAKHVPGLQRVTQLQLHAAMVDRAVEWKAKLALRVETSPASKS